jgi:hypothetical protein
MAVVHTSDVKSSKVSGEDWCCGFARSFGLEMVWLGRCSFFTPGGSSGITILMDI